jgi:hypothetical protein
VLSSYQPDGWYEGEWKLRILPHTVIPITLKHNLAPSNINMSASHQPSSSFQNLTNKLHEKKKENINKQTTTIKLIPSPIRSDIQQFLSNVWHWEVPERNILLRGVQNKRKFMYNLLDHTSVFWLCSRMLAHSSINYLYLVLK